MKIVTGHHSVSEIFMVSLWRCESNSTLFGDSLDTLNSVISSVSGTARIRKIYYIKVEWPKREVLTVERTVSAVLEELAKVYLPPLHIKLT